MNREREHQLTTADLAHANERAAHERAPRDRAIEQPHDDHSHDHPPLFVERDATDLRKQWNDTQAGFVDEPREAVKRADALVADVMKRLAESFASERANLEHQWDRGDNVTTEDLRVALQRYRSFFDRLLAV